MTWLLIASPLLAVLGILLIVLAQRVREARGLLSGETVALDNVTLFSEKLLLIGRPDRIVREGEFYIPEEWKSSKAKRINQGHKLQLGTYFILIEEEYGVRPPHGFVVLGDGERVKVENTQVLRSEVLRIAGEIREHRRHLREVIRVNQPSWKCRKCGQRPHCSQSRG